MMVLALETSKQCFKVSPDIFFSIDEIGGRMGSIPKAGVDQSCYNTQL